jgi:aryl-alcohol dehydrogenase-like predicted oxidoreductase
MQYRQLGSAGIKVSSLCLGAMTFGEADEKSFMHGVGADEATSFAIMNRARDAGINFIDVADVYGPDGLSERVVGRWLQVQKSRHDVVLATKFRFRMHAGPNGNGASRHHILRSVDDSLARLQTDHIDLYQIHMQDMDTPEEETLRALDDVVRAGKVRYIGASNYTGYRLADAMWTSRTQHLEHFVTLQAQYSLAVRDVERECVPASVRHGVGLLPWSPLAGGFLSGRHDVEGATGSRMAKWPDRYKKQNNDRGRAILAALRDIAAEHVVAEHSASSSSVALAWLLAKPVVTSVIFGARTVDQLDDNLRAVDLQLTAAQMERLDGASAFDVGYPYEFIGQVQKRW